MKRITFFYWIMIIGSCCFTNKAIGQEAITLEKAIKYAEVNSPDIRQTIFRLQRSELLLKAQRAGLKSRFSLTANPFEYSKNRRFNDRLSQWYTNESLNSSGTFQVEQPILLTDGTISLVNRFGWQKNISNASGQSTDNKAFTNNLYLNLKQPIFTYNKRKLELKSLELDLENANIGYAMQRLNLEKMVTQQFYNVYMAQMNLNISEEELRNSQKNFDIIKNKVEAGLAAKEELYQAEVNLSNAKSSVQNRKVNLENIKDAFKDYIGMDLAHEIVILTDVSVKPVPVDLKKAIASGLDSRMEIRQRKIDIDRSQFQLIKTKAMNEFRGEVNLSVGIIGDDEKLGNIYDKPTSNPKVSVSLNIPIFDWGAKKARVKAQETSIESSKLNLDQEKKSIVINIRKVYRNLQNQLIQIDIAKKSVRNAQLTYEINKEKYQNGDLTGMQLNQYQTQLSNKKIAYSQALINYKIELLNLKIQALYDFENKQAVVPQQLYLKKK